MKPDNPIDPLGARRQKRRPKMQRALLLPEPHARNHTNTRRIQQSQTVKLIRLPALLPRLLNRLLRQSDGGEEIHGPLRRLAVDALHFGKSGVEGAGAGEERGVGGVVFGAVEGVRGRGGLRRIDHHFDEALADDGRAELDGDEFVDLRFDLWTGVLVVVGVKKGIERFGQVGKRVYVKGSNSRPDQSRRARNIPLDAHIHRPCPC